MKSQFAAKDVKDELESGTSEVNATEKSPGSWFQSLYKKFLKTTIGEKASYVVSQALEEVEDIVKPAAVILPEKGVAPAGQELKQAETGKTQSSIGEHTVVTWEHPVLSPSAKPDILAAQPAKLEISKEISAEVPEPSVDQSKNTLVIKNLPFKYKPSDLDTLLLEHQANPKNVRLLRDNEGRFTGMAFIRCPSKEEAQRLIKSMNGLDIGGRVVQVEFKLKKKKRSKLTTSTDSLSSTDEIATNQLPLQTNLTEMPSVIVEPSSTIPVSVVPQPTIGTCADVVERKTRKLAVSADHNMGARAVNDDKFKKPPQLRRKSTSTIETNVPSFYAHSAVQKSYNNSGPSIRPIRQPIGPDGKSTGFSEDYRNARTVY